MQSFRQCQQGGPILTRRSGKHHGDACHEEGRTQFSPAVGVGFAPGTQIRKAVFQVPIHRRREMAIRTSTDCGCKLNFHVRAYGSCQRIKRGEVTVVAPAQPGKTLLAQSSATRPGSIGQTRATRCAGQRIQELFEVS